MTEETKAAETQTAGAKKKATKRKKASKPRTKKPEGARKAGSRTKKEKSVNAEAHFVVGSRLSTIVEHLLGRSMTGDTKSAQLLVGMADKEAEAKEALRHGPLRSQALAWAAEPEWQDEMDMEKAETSSGGREAE
jgi:hypothetical protein